MWDPTMTVNMHEDKNTQRWMHSKKWICELDQVIFYGPLISTESPRAIKQWPANIAALIEGELKEKK